MVEVKLIDLIELRLQEQARRDFWAFRQYMHPRLVRGWWQRDAALHMQRFYHDWKAGLRPRMLIQAPPQHGKSMMVVDFIAWVLGHDPDARVIYASFSGRLGTRANLQLQRMMDMSRYRGCFNTLLPERGDNPDRKQRNTEILEFTTGEGYFRNTTVRGPITGEGLDLGVLDDPLKGQEEARSALVRDNTWEWLTDDFMTRFSDEAAMLGIMTRWHLDDPFGRLMESSDVQVLKYPAIAEADDEHRKEGEALFPELKSLEFLEQRRAVMAAPNWEALYQQNPIVAGGNLFKMDWWQFYDDNVEVEWRGCWADTAQKTKEHNDYSVFQCWGRTTTGQAVLLDQMRGKWEAPELKARAAAFWAKHHSLKHSPLRFFKVEDKVSGTGLIQELARTGIPMLPVQRRSDKVTRAWDVAPFIESGNVLLPQRASWLDDFLAEATAFPAGAHDDQVDPMMDAVSEILSNPPQLRIRVL